MGLFKKAVTPIILISNEEIYFIIQGGSGEGKISEPVPLNQFLTGDVDLSAVPEAFRHQSNSVMVVPDYWLGDTSFPFQSRKKSLADAFLERKLVADFPDIPEVEDFYAYFFHQFDQGETAVYAYFLRDPAFYELYERLAQWNLHPRRITTPALLWESQLKERIPGFHEGGKVFVHNLSNECFLYFFFSGHFLFSRQITLPEIREDSADQLDTLTYETHQSLYLFSQKAKVEIDRIYMVAFGHVDPAELSEKLGREVEGVAVHIHHLRREPPECERLFYDARAVTEATERLRQVAQIVARWHPTDATAPPLSVGPWCEWCDHARRCLRFR